MSNDIAKEAVDKLFSGLNSFNASQFGNNVVRYIKDEHRTLQQTFMREILVKFIETEAKSSYFDERNRKTHELCVMFHNYMEEHKEDTYLPFI